MRQASWHVPAPNLGAFWKWFSACENKCIWFICLVFCIHQKKNSLSATYPHVWVVCWSLSKAEHVSALVGTQPDQWCTFICCHVWRASCVSACVCMCWGLSACVCTYCKLVMSCICVCLQAPRAVDVPAIQWLVPAHTEKSVYREECVSAFIGLCQRNEHEFAFFCAFIESWAFICMCWFVECWACVFACVCTSWKLGTYAHILVGSRAQHKLGMVWACVGTF